MVYIVMGVSGSGKTTVGQLLAQKLQLPFYDGDDFHTGDNILRMKNGTALTDDNRQDWLEVLARKIFEWDSKGGAVLACSALKEKYRQTLRSTATAQTEWIYLKGSEELIRKRLSAREAHFMNKNLLHSQFDILEEPAYGIKVSVQDNPQTVVENILTEIKKAKQE